MDLITLGISAGAVIATPLGVFIRKVYTQGDRLTVLETQYKNVDDKLTELHNGQKNQTDKLDRLIDKFL